MHTSEQCKRLNWWLDLARSCGWWQPFKGVVFVCERPAIQSVDDRGRLHAEGGPAILCRDGWPVYAWRGVRVPEHVIVAPEKITPSEIDTEPNTEIRRVMIERFGQQRYLVEGGAKAIHSDDYGTLYRKRIPGDEPLVMVKVVNSTPEPDGTFKDYFLRVPPQFNRAKDAVAWTFEMSPQEYELAQQT